MPDQPTPEDIAAYEAAVGGAQQVNPIRDLSAEDLAALAVQDKQFSIPDAFRSQPELHGDKAVVQKAADALNLVKQRGFSLEDLPTVAEAGKTVYGAAKGFGKQLWNYANAAGNIVAGAVSELAGQSGLAKAYGEDIDARLAQNIAGTEEAMTGLAQLGEKGAKKVARTVGLSKSFKDFTPDEKVADLFADVGKAEVGAARLSGAGPFTGAVTSGSAAPALQQAGVTPEQVGELAAGDPFSFFLFGKAGQLAGAAVPSAVKAIPAVVESAAAKALPAIGGGAIQAAGKAAELGAGGIEVAGKVSSVLGPIAGGVSALTGGDIATAGISGLASGAGGAALKRLGQLAKPVAQKVTQLGREIGGRAPVTGAASQFGRDVLQALPGAAGEVAKGFGLDLGLAAVTAETPIDTQGAVGFGTALGALGGAGRIAGHALSGQLIAPREYGANTVIPSSGAFPAFDTMHNEAMKAASPGVRTRLNAIREFVAGAAPETDVFMGRDSAAIESALKAAGVSDATAKNWAAQQGLFTADLNGRRVVVLKNVDAAPHESFHAIQDVLGEDANRQIDRIVRESYGNRWDTEGQRYADRLGRESDATWQETVLDRSGWGLTEAKEKIYRDIYNRVVGETGAEPAPGLVEQLAKTAFGRVMDEAVARNPQIEPNEVSRHVWREILSPEESTEVADRYLAREIAAENFDALFKRTGQSLQPTGIAAKLAGIVGGLINAVGGEPLAGRTSEIGQVPLSTPVIEAVRTAGRGERPTLEPTRAPELPSLPPSNTLADEARDIAASAPDQPIAGGTKSPRELLGVIAEAIANQGGVKINYLSAPGEPAAATSSNRDVRRAIIEAYRTMPQEARALWEKNFFPDKVIQTKGGKYQIQGWAPEVFASNAHKLAKFLTEVPDAAGLSPYPIDTARGTFTTEGWKQLFEDTQQFVQNQIRGATGAGEPLVVPRSVTESGGYAPPTRPGARPLEQTRADFINTLFNFRLPDSPRIVSGRRPLNIQAQEVSIATKPGRIRVPVEPRQKFSGPEAERQNIAGREILETNPLRNQLERAASEAGVAMPSFIEAIQKLNLENIKEVAGTPEQPQFRGNTLTLSAGFQPATAAGKSLEKQGFEFRRVGGPSNPGIEIFNQGNRVGEILAVRKSPKEADVAMVNVTKPYQGQGISEVLYRELGQRLKEEGVSDLTGMIVNDRALKSRSKVFPDTEIESITEFTPKDRSYEVRSRIPENAQFNPVELADRVEKFSPDEFRSWVDSVKGAFTQEAWRVGQSAPTREFADSLRARYDALSKKSEELVKSLATLPIDQKLAGLNDLSAMASQAQFFREAHEAATGTASAGKALRQADPNYKPPFPPESEQLTAQAQPKRFEDPEFETVVKRISKGEQDGETFNADGTVFRPAPGEKLDVVTLASKNVPASELTAATVADAFPQLSSLLDDPNVKIGLFKMSSTDSQGRPQVSVDMNVVVDQAHRENTAEFARQNNQESFFDLNKFETVNSGGDGNTVLKDPAQISEAVQNLVEGQPVQFSPKKKTDEYKLQPPKSGFSKAWVLPNGTPVQLGGTWHHQWLADNPKIAEKYGLDIPAFEGTDTEGVREAALKAGFARVNYSQNSGTLTVEARARDWRRIKPAIERMAESNLDDIDNMSVTLLDETASKVVDSQSARLFNYDDAEKLQHLPFITEGEVRGQFSPESEQGDLIETPRGAQSAIKKEISMLKIKHQEALPLQYRTNEDGSFRLDAKGKPTPVGIPYGLYDTPLAKAAVKGKRGDEAKENAIVDAYAGRIKSAYSEAKKNPAIAAGANWYSLAREKLQKFFGPDTKFFTELLGATSAQTDVPTNFKYSIDAYNNFKAGKYDDIIRKYQEGKEIWETGDLGLEPGEKSLAEWLSEAGLEKDATRAAWMKWWIDTHDLKPKQSNGKLFGANSDAVLKVLDGSWRESVQGPKTPNFAGNLSGDSFEATIDIWAARLLHRLGNEGNTKRWRILPKNETGVTDPDFFLGQKAFRKAGDELGISPDSLQAIMWFAEKDYWDKQPGWTKSAAARKKSDFNVLLDRTTREGDTLKILPEELEKPSPKVDKQQIDLQFSPEGAKPGVKKSVSVFVPMPQDEAERIADAIYIAEGGAKAKIPYGILSVKVDSEAEARKVAINTIKNNYKRWHDAGEPGDYLAFLASRYAPTKNATNDPQGLNNNWLKNVRRLLKK